MTKREFLTAVASANLSAEMTAFAQSELAALNSRNEKRATSNAAKREVANEPFITAIMAALAKGKHFAAEIATFATNNGTNMSTSKASALLSKLVDKGVVRVSVVSVPKVGKRNYYEFVPTSVQNDDECDDYMKEYTPYELERMLN